MVQAAQQEISSEPNSILAEQAVIGVLLSRADLLSAVSPSLRPEDFYAEQHRLIYSTMLDMAAAGELIDLVGVQDRLSQVKWLENAGGPAYISELIFSAPSGTNIAAHVAMIRERSTRRKVIKAADKIKEVAASSANLEQGTNTGIEDLFGLLREGGSMKEPSLIREILPDVIDNIDQRSKGQDGAIKTGFDHFDAKLLGGLRRGDLVVIAGRPSMGKTAYGCQIGAAAAMAGETVMVFTLEMSREQIGERLLAQIGGIDYSRIVKGALIEEDYDRMSYALQKLHSAPLLIDDTGGLTVQDIAARARAQSKMGGLSMIVVDYLQIMSHAGRALGRAEQLGEMSRAMKALAKELNVVFVLLSQLNRDVEKRPDKRPVMSDLRESGAIEQDADLVVMMYRDDYYNPDSEFKGKAEAIVRKNRNGETGTVGLGFEGERVRFRNLSSEWGRSFD
ncbi:MAG: replicative DNA helicase [Hydrogenophilales bacterium 17-61-9]|nr:MAG: replicative DNA helicase [Hydrogenophilales bacterium 17-61-9]